MAINLQTTKEKEEIGSSYFTQENPYKIIAHIERAAVFMNKKEYNHAIKILEEIEFPKISLIKSNLEIEKDFLLMKNYTDMIMQERYSGISKNSPTLQNYSANALKIGTTLKQDHKYSEKAEKLEEIISIWMDN